MSRPVLLADPLTCPGCYSLDLYCRYSFEGHAWDEFPHQFVGETGGQCRKQAKARGWRMHRDGTATCPKCLRTLTT